MPPNYTISPTDDPSYKQLICGRTNDITKLLDFLVNEQSVALFGERRIGKTSLLYLLTDIINEEIDSYYADLIDLELQQAIYSLKTKVSNYGAIYLNLLNINKPEVDSFVKLLHKELQASDLTNTFYVSPNSTLVESFEAINKALPEDKQLIVLIDEVEVLMDMQDGIQIFRNLRGIIQSCSKIHFVFAGAESWHKQIKDKTSPLVNTVQTFYLKAAARYPITYYLITTPLQDKLVSARMGEVRQAIVEWTECKPWPVQAICLAVLEVREADRELPDNWKVLVQDQVGDAIGLTLTAFYENNNLTELSQKILALLANRPGLTIKQISDNLGYSEKQVTNTIGDLEDLDKIHKQGADYRIAGTLIEWWGTKTQDTPTIRSPWPQRIKWIGATIFLLVAIGIYFYTHPSLQTHPPKVLR